MVRSFIESSVANSRMVNSNKVASPRTSWWANGWIHSRIHAPRPANKLHQDVKRHIGRVLMVRLTVNSAPSVM